MSYRMCIRLSVRGEDILNTSSRQEDNEKKKEYLQRYSKAKKDLERAELLYKEIMLSFYPSCSIGEMGGMGGSASHADKDLSDNVAHKEMIKKRYLKKRYQKLKILTEIKNAIERLDDPDEKNVLVHRYILLKRWDDICLDLDISWRQIHRIHSQALEHFDIPVQARQQDKKD